MGGIKSDWPILLWGGASQGSVQATQLPKLAGCAPIIVTASEKVSCNIPSLLYLQTISWSVAYMKLSTPLNSSKSI
jgi:NADPH:quinone reductase-like Zn-dependent oxidoreductase